MLPCKGCAYHESIPGDAHSRCAYDWMRQDPEGLVGMFKTVSPRTAKWFRFPFNYDPTWGPSECAQRSETRDPEKIAKPNPWTDLLSLLR